MIVCDDLILTGLVHQAEHVSCQDAISTFRNKRNVAVALCDGAGSYQLVDVAAKRMSREAARLMARNLNRYLFASDDRIKKDFLHLIRSVLSDLHRDYPQADSLAFGSTLLIVAANSRDYISFQLGDGAIMIQQNSGSNSVHILSTCIPDENRGTYLTTSDDRDILEHSVIRRGKYAKGFLLTSDGAENRLYNETEISSSCAHILNNFRQGLGQRYRNDLLRQIECDLKPVDDFSLGILLPSAPTASALSTLFGFQDSPISLRSIMKAIEKIDHGIKRKSSVSKSCPRKARQAILSILHTLYVR